MKSIEESGMYQYKPLRERGAIRLIDLQPSPDVDAQVECSLTHTTLYDCEKDTLNHYIALSYVWGDALDTATILVDGMKLDITANLDSALRHVRDKNRPRRVWADAVCICQQDLEEKSIHVQQMGEVYRTAQRTVIYLGEATKHSDDVLNYIARQHEQTFGSSSSDVRLPQPSRLKTHDIISRPWFTRVWIFQELLLSRDPWLQCGKVKAPWKFFAKYVLDRPRPSGDRDELQQAYRKFLEMHSSRTKFLKDDAREETSWATIMSNLFDYMVKRGGLGVTNPVDIVYAHLGIAGYSFGDEGRHKFHIDYTKTPKQVFEEITNHIMSDCDGAQHNILSYAKGSVDFDRRDRDLASWCPDWRKPSPATVHISIRDALLCMNQKHPEEGLGVTKRVPPMSAIQNQLRPHLPVGLEYFPIPHPNPSIHVSPGRVVGQIMSLSAEISAEQAAYQCQALDEVDSVGRFSINPKILISIWDHWDRLFPIKVQYETRTLGHWSPLPNSEEWRARLEQNGRKFVTDKNLFSSSYMLQRLSYHCHLSSKADDLLRYNLETLEGKAC